MHPFASYCIGSLGGGGGLRGGDGDVVCKRLALASAGVVSLGVPSTGVVPIGAAVDDEGDGAGSRGDVATDNPHNSASAAASTTKVPRRNRADVIQNLTHSLQGAAGRVASQVCRSAPKKLSRQKKQWPIFQNKVASYWAHSTEATPALPNVRNLIRQQTPRTNDHTRRTSERISSALQYMYARRLSAPRPPRVAAPLTQAVRAASKQAP